MRKIFFKFCVFLRKSELYHGCPLHSPSPRLRHACYVRVRRAEKKSFLARIFFLDSSFPACCHEHAVRDECTYKEHLVHYCFSFNESQKKIWMHSGQCLNRWWNYGEFSKSHSFIEWICINSSLCSDYWLKRHFLQEFLKNFCDIFLILIGILKEFQLEKSNGFGILLEFFKNSDPSVNSEQKMKHTK